MLYRCMSKTQTPKVTKTTAFKLVEVETMKNELQEEYVRQGDIEVNTETQMKMFRTPMLHGKTDEIKQKAERLYCEQEVKHRDAIEQGQRIRQLCIACKLYLEDVERDQRRKN